MEWGLNDSAPDLFIWGGDVLCAISNTTKVYDKIGMEIAFI
jgi:hypothetical protein